MLRAIAIRPIVLLALATGLIFGIAGSATATAVATVGQEEREGKGLAELMRAGEKRCADLSSNEFELIGEYAMGGYLGSEGTHSTMNRRMTLMMGEAGERRMHTALGYRYSGCSGGPASGWVGPMAGMMGGSGIREPSDRSGPMMGSGGGGGSGVSTMGGVLIALASAALGAGMGALFMKRQQSGKDAAP